MSSRYDFSTAIQDWRDDEARAGRDPEGDRMERRSNARFLRETYCDGADYAEPVKAPVKAERMQMTLNFEEVA